MRVLSLLLYSYCTIPVRVRVRVCTVLVIHTVNSNVFFFSHATCCCCIFFSFFWSVCGVVAAFSRNGKMSIGGCGRLVTCVGMLVGWFTYLFFPLPVPHQVQFIPLIFSGKQYDMIHFSNYCYSNVIKKKQK